MTPEFHKWMMNGLRRISYRWPPRYKTKLAARVERGVYKCARKGCGNHPAKEVQLDHIKPVIDPKTGFVDWNTYIERLFVGPSGWQVLCKKHHKQKSKRENARRSRE